MTQYVNDKLEKFIEKSKERAFNKVVEHNYIFHFIRAHVLLSREGKIHLAHALEFDIVAQGKTEFQAKKNIVTAIFDYIFFGLNNDLSDKIVSPAPIEYWREYLKSNKSEEKDTKSKEQNLPFSKGIIEELNYALST